MPSTVSSPSEERHGVRRSAEPSLAVGDRASPPPFVARERELARLDDALGAAMEGHGRVCFVVGEAGSGKTALVREFARRAQDRHDDLIVAIGQSDAYTGAGDPFLPFRELLLQLTGDVDAKLAEGRISEENAGRLQRFLGISGQAVVDLGPDLIGAFVPGAALAARAAAFIARKSGQLDKLDDLAELREPIERGGIDQTNIFEQYTNVITRLATEQPLLLILDDLQWADAASIGLLFRLGRSLGDSRVLLMGTYRPAEVASGRGNRRHPLEKVVSEFKRYFGDSSVDLGDVGPDESRRLVDAVLDAEPQRLSQNFRLALYDHTQGHPLFTIELLRALQERGDLVKDNEDRWVEGASLDWDTIPARVEGVIEERIGRLDEYLREALTVGSVEGEDFTAEVIARVQSIEVRRLVHRLGRELVQQHRLIRSRGQRRLTDTGSRFSLYTFHHNLLQRYLYLNLSEADRVYLHEDVGNALEELCAGCIDEFVVQLARHFDEAGLADKAAAYLRRAGELSRTRFANQEAIEYFTRALTLTPATESFDLWALLSAREQAYELEGDREAQSDDLDALRAVAEELDDDAMRAEVALRTAALANATGDYPEAIVAAEQAIHFGALGRDLATEARAHLEWGYSLLEQGMYEDARARCEYSLGLAESGALHDIQSTVLRAIARIHMERGEVDEAKAGFEEALRICERLNDSFGEARIINNIGVMWALHGDLKKASGYFEQTFERAHRIGDRRLEAMALFNLGELAQEWHDLSSARRWYEKALPISVITDDQALESEVLVGIGGLSVKLGLFDDAELHLKRSLDISQRIGQRSVITDALRWHAVLACSRGKYQEAREYSQRAVEIAHAIQYQRLEDRSWQSLGRSLEGLGMWADAAEAYQEAMALLKGSGLPSASTEPAAGLARIALAQGDLVTAQSFVDGILDQVGVGNLDGAQEPIAVYLACYRVLAAAGDSRAGSVLAEAHRFLMNQAESIKDPEAKRAFLENVTANQEILSLAATAEFA